MLHLKHLNRHLECTDVSFNPENGAFSTIKKQTDNDYCNPLRACALRVNNGTDVRKALLEIWYIQKNENSIGLKLLSQKSIVSYILLLN